MSYWLAAAKLQFSMPVLARAVTAALHTAVTVSCSLLFSYINSILREFSMNTVESAGI